jgi:hypothetical protein
VATFSEEGQTLNHAMQTSSHAMQTLSHVTQNSSRVAQTLSEAAEINYMARNDFLQASSLGKLQISNYKL